MSTNSSTSAPSATAEIEPSGRNDENLKRVLAALSDESWDFRTVDGICKATGFTPELVAQILEAHPEVIRISPVPDRKGRPLYTLRSRSPRFKEILASLRAFVSKST